MSTQSGKDTKIIDFHTHAFSDAIAPKAIKALQAGCPAVKCKLDGTVSDLINSMDKAGIEKSVICSIVTKPKQFEPIIEWSKQIASDRIVPFASIHPDDPDRIERVSQVKEAGIKGIKIHPYYQGFVLDEEKMFEFYQKISDEGLILVSHTGNDIAFDFDDRANPKRILNVVERFGDLKFVTTHLGGWQMWDGVNESIIGKNVYMEISFAFGYLPGEKIREMIDNHPIDYIFFGTDSPWFNQADSVAMLKSLGLSEEKLNKILYSNAVRLLGE